MDFFHLHSIIVLNCFFADKKDNNRTFSKTHFFVFFLVKASTEQTGELTLGCGTWTIGQSGCYKHFVEEKSWQAAREQCREEGRSQGVSDADLAYFDDATERDDVIEGRSYFFI